MNQTFLTRSRTLLALWRFLLLYGLVCIGVVFAMLAAPPLSPDSVPPMVVAPTTAGQTPIPTLGVTVQWDNAPTPMRRADLQRLHDIGFQWIRLRVKWADLEPTPGLYDWTFYDTVLTDITTLGIDPIVVLDGSPDWARAPFEQGLDRLASAPPADTGTFATFAGAFAHRYADQIRYYQIWDEPNIAPHWGTQHIEPVAYAQLLRSAAQAIRAADPDARIISAALAPTVDRGHTAIDENLFLQRLYAAGAAASWDIVAIQPFGFGYSPTNSPYADRLNFQRATLIRRTMVAAGDAKTPVWAVRFGWNTRLDSRWGTVTQTNQQVYTRAALEVVASQWPWLSAIGWAIDRPQEPIDNPIWGFALNPPLAAIFADWIESPRVTPVQPKSEPIAPGYPSLWLFLGAAVVIGWRALAALRHLPLSNVIHRMASLPNPHYWIAWSMFAAVYYFATWLPLLVVCCLGVILLMAARPRAGLWVTVACLPFYYQHKAFRIAQFEWDAPPAHLLILCLLVASIGLWWRMTDQCRLQWDRWQALAVAWFVVNCLSSVNVWYWPGYQTGMMDLVVVPLLLFFAARIHCRSSRDLYDVALASIAGGVVVALVGLAGWLTGGGTSADGMRRLVGPHFSPNHTALYLIRCLTLSMGLTIAYRSRLSRRLLLASGSLIAPALILTGSRGALLLGLPAGFLSLLLFYFTKRDVNYHSLISRLRRQPSLVYVAGAFVVLGISGLMLYLMGDRLANSATIRARLAIWRYALDLWRDYPLFGIGPDGFYWRFPTYIPLDSSLDPNLRHPHNLVIEFATGWGTIGLAWLLTALVLVIHHLRRWQTPKAAIALAATASLVAAVAHAMVDAFAALPDIAAWNWLALAIITHPTAARLCNALPIKKAASGRGGPTVRSEQLSSNST